MTVISYMHDYDGACDVGLMIHDFLLDETAMHKPIVT